LSPSDSCTGSAFAGALLDAGLPQRDVPLALFAFNVGVECGQLIFIAVLLGSAWAIRCFGRGESLLLRIRPVAAYGIGAVAGFWLIERSLSLFAA
jgi:hypothetical protein